MNRIHLFNWSRNTILHRYSHSIQKHSHSTYYSSNPFSFDTYKFVRELERQGLSRKQAVAIMLSISNLFYTKTSQFHSQLLSKIDMDNDTYSYQVNFKDYKNELHLLRQNDFAALKSESESIYRDVENLNQQFSELMSNFKSEVGMDLNNHKSDAREIGTEIDLRTQQITHKLLVKISILKTSIETMKVELTRDIVWYSCAFFMAVLLLDFLLPSPKSASKKNGSPSIQTNSNDSQTLSQSQSVVPMIATRSVVEIDHVKQ